MKRFAVLVFYILILLFLGGVSYASDTLIDSNSNVTENWGDFGSYSEWGQSLTVSQAWNITSIKFYLDRTASASGTLYAKVYNATGTVGTNAVPTGSALGTSDGIDASSIAYLSPAWYEFTFSTPATVSSGDIVVTCYSSTGTAYVRIYIDTAKSHAGNASYKYITWTAESGCDLPFYVYGVAGWNEKINDITTQGKINDVEIADIAKVNDVEAD